MKKGEEIRKKAEAKAAAKAAAERQKLIDERNERLAARKDPKLHEKGAPLGFSLKGVTTHVNSDGEIISQYIKTKQDQVDPELVLRVFKDAITAEPPRARTLVPPPSREPLRTDLMCVYPMGDPHIGLLSWGKETGEPFDLAIAERNLTGAVDKLVHLAPASETALIVNLGDFFHADNMDARTWRSGHKLDVDSRWAKVLRIGINIMNRIVDRALEKHAKVRVINEIGNHDDHSAIMLSLCMEQRWLGNPRVEIDISPQPFHYHRFGSVFIGTHHGNLVKPDKLGGVMATDRAREWGETKFRYWLTGHVHHESKKEFPGYLWETFRTLAARDAYAHSSGYRSQRSMVCDVHHVDQGRVLRHEVGVAALA